MFLSPPLPLPRPCYLSLFEGLEKESHTDHDVMNVTDTASASDAHLPLRDHSWINKGKISWMVEGRLCMARMGMFMRLGDRAC